MKMTAQRGEEVTLYLWQSIRDVRLEAAETFGDRRAQWRSALGSEQICSTVAYSSV